MKRELTQQEMQVIQRHKNRRDEYIQRASEAHQTLNEIVALIAGPGAEVDLEEGTVTVPEENEHGIDDGLDAVEAAEVREADE